MHFWEVTFVTIDDLKLHVDNILNALPEKNVSREELEQEIEKFIEYGVPIDQAKQTLIKKFGGAVKFNSLPSSDERTLISDVKPNQPSVNLLCRVIAINPKEITVKGENRQIFYGIFGDESGTVSFTSWKEIDVKKGDVIELANAYTREWQGVVQLNIGDRAEITKTDKDKLPKSAFEPKEFKVGDLKSGMSAVEVTARILQLTKREVSVSGEAKKVFSGTIADETGKAQFTSWHDFKLKEGDAYKISGGYVKSWKGIPQFTFDDKSAVKKIDNCKIPKNLDSTSSKMTLHELVEKRGGLDVEVEGTIIEIRTGSGVVKRCPECNRVLMNEECAIHGTVEGLLDLRIKLIVDDGAGAASAVLNKEMSEKVLGKTLEECKEMNEDELKNEMNKTLFTKMINLKGNALSDEFGTTLIPKDAEVININISKEVAKISKEVEELQ